MKLRGLDPQKRYAIRAIEGAVAPGVPTKASGAYWMEYGLEVDLRGDFQAVAFVLESTS